MNTKINIPKEYSSRMEFVMSQLNTGIESDISNLYNSLVVSTNSISRLPEHIFVGNYLPFFCGEVTINKCKDILIHWVAIAGSPTSKVNIIDRVGNILFTVPALVDTSFLDITKNDSINGYNNIFGNYSMEMTNIPIVAQNNLILNLDKKFDMITKKSDESLTEAEKTWNAIFLKYGKIKPTTVNDSAKTNSNEDDFIYE